MSPPEPGVRPDPRRAAPPPLLVPPPTAPGDSLSEANYERIARLVRDHAGIKLPVGKRIMLEGRLRKRVRALGLADIGAYCALLFQGGGLQQELTHLIDVVTTNKTDFFREIEHFTWLRRHIVPELLAAPGRAQPPFLKVWSAACSNGSEPYSIAMLLADLSREIAPFRFAVLGTDISTEMLAHAERAIYPEPMLEPAPAEMRARYLLSARRPGMCEVRIVPELRRLVHFAQLNLMDPTYAVDQDVDVIFLRNVLIYFERETQEAVTQRLASHLRPGGFLILGHSESMIGSNLRLRQRAPSIFQRV